MQLPKISNKKRGSLLVEIIICFSILTMTLFTFYLSFLNIYQEVKNINSMRIALYNSEMYLENILLTSKINFYTPLLINYIHEGLKTTLINHYETPCKKFIQSVTSWNSPRNVELDATTTNTLEATKLGNDCEGVTNYSWTPHSQSIVLLDQGALTRSMDVKDSFLFVSSSSTPDTPSNFFIESVKNRNQPELVFKKQFPDTFNNIDVANDYLYAAVASSTNQLQIMDVSNPYFPFFVSTATLPNVSGSYPEGKSIYYYNSKVYIGTHRTAGNEFHVFDVTDPSQPEWLGSIELNHNINAIIVRDNYAYLATSGNTKNLIILDIHDPKNIIQISSLAFSGTEDSISLFLLDNYLYIGRVSSINADSKDFNIVDINDPLHPNIVGSYKTGASVEAIRVIDTTAYLGLNNRSLLALDISNPNQPNFIKKLELEVDAINMDIENNILFVSMINAVTLFSS